MPVGNLAGKHVVTIEGLNLAKDPTPVQHAIVEHGATQCGYCTPGFVVSLTGFCLQDGPYKKEQALRSIDGNICRCTGYQSLKMAAEDIVQIMKNKRDQPSLPWLIDQGALPAYFADIPNLLSELVNKKPLPHGRLIGGGTDLYVQMPDELVDEPVRMASLTIPKGIKLKDQTIVIGAGTSTESLRTNPIMQCLAHDWPNLLDLVSSTPIRNMATVGGNFVNASPIGDLSIYFFSL